MACITQINENTFRIRFSEGFYEDGRRNSKSFTVKCSSRRQAELERDKISAQLQSGSTYSPSKMTLNELSKRWLETYVEKNLAPATQQSYKEKLKMHIIPYLGNKRADKITPYDIDNLYNKLLEKPSSRKNKNGDTTTLSPTTVHRVHEVLSSMFSCALRWNLVPYNPCTKVIKPKYKRTKMSCYDEETSKKLITTLLQKAPTKYKCFVILAMLTGLRRGELVGLHWDDIDFKKSTITVNRSACYLGKQGTFEKDTKTDASNRTIAVSNICFELLKQWRAEQSKIRLAQGANWKGAENIFATDDGRIMNPATGPKWFSKFIAKNNFPHIRFHDLRHTFATLLVNNNVDVNTVSHKLGHASTTTTLQFYVHNLESTDRASADLLEDLLVNNVNAR